VTTSVAEPAAAFEGRGRRSAVVALLLAAGVTALSVSPAAVDVVRAAIGEPAVRASS
jgi:hypothetical protein